MKIDPRHLEILAAIVDEGGLTEGAAVLGKSQPSVSRTLKQLEARIGQALFKPNRRPLQPTELGLVLAEQGRAILKADRIASDIIDSYRQGTSGVARVGGTPFFMDGVISQMIASFQYVCPDVRVDQSYGFVPDLIERLLNRTLDLAIAPLQESQIPDTVTFVPILDGFNVIACRSGHPLARQKIVHKSDLSAFPWITPAETSPLYQDLKRALEDFGTDHYKVRFTGGSLSSVLSVLTGSDALTVLPHSVVLLSAPRGSLAILPVRLQHPPRRLGLLNVTETPSSPATQRFRRYVAQEFKKLDTLLVAAQKDLSQS